MKDKQQAKKSNHIITKLILIVITGVFLSGCINNQEISSKKEKIDDLLNYCYENELFNGTVLVASNDVEIVGHNILYLNT